jgi:hypothetical protein
MQDGQLLIDTLRPPQLAASFISNPARNVACWHESAASNPEGMDRRRMVAVEAVIIEVLFCNNASMRHIFQGARVEPIR